MKNVYILLLSFFISFPALQAQDFRSDECVISYDNRTFKKYDLKHNRFCFKEINHINESKINKYTWPPVKIVNPGMITEIINAVFTKEERLLIADESRKINQKERLFFIQFVLDKNNQIIDARLNGIPNSSPVWAMGAEKFISLITQLKNSRYIVFQVPNNYPRKDEFDYVAMQWRLFGKDGNLLSHDL